MKNIYFEKLQEEITTLRVQVAYTNERVSLAEECIDKRISRGRR